MNSNNNLLKTAISFLNDELKKRVITRNGLVVLSAKQIEDYNTGSSDCPNIEIVPTLAFDEDDCHLVSSMTINGMHKPVLDIDLPVLLEPSSSPGKFHLIIDKELSANEYDKLINTLVEVGILQKGIKKYQWDKNGFTAVRLPGVMKPGSNKKPGTWTKD